MRNLTQHLDAMERATFDQTAATRAVRTIGPLVQEIPEARDSSDPEKNDLSRCLVLLDRLHEHLSDAATESFLRAVILGKLGRLAEAIGHSRSAFKESPSWQSAVMLANALRRNGDIAGAVSHFQAAASLDSKDVTALLEIGDIHLEASRWSEAISAYELALQREKRQAWALPSVCYCKYRVTSDRRWLRRLRAYVQRPVDECGVGPALARLLGGYSTEHSKYRAQVLLARIEEPGE